ncbi:heterokaryon incompatibility protein-domain-containing protein [Apodospora peruviana]|uniref:Heterokaryon incompatibility protein-domain-containing protein n=1 Tax=Apodospora peruviana TaxID=516989 RepID=A0AAE0HT12_9PEZI|nr:heterokaryon incompatibility protein-domain-containing protein [Apodospora peruviana]
MAQQNTRKRRRADGELEALTSDRPRTRNYVACQLRASDGARLCESCRSIDFNAISGVEVKGCGKWRDFGRRVHQGLRVTSGTTDCDLCAFFQHLLTPKIGARPDICAYSARVAFKVPRDVLARDTPLLALVPGRKEPQTEKHPLESGNIFMECLDDPTRFGGRRIGPQVDFALITSWLDFCKDHHTQLCRPKASDVASIPGFRVIDCRTRERVRWSNLTGEAAEFTALSYVWGAYSDGDSTTVDDTLPKQLPRLIEDAIEVTARLNYRYLWVDRYCIPKDSDAERHTQIQKMNLIYGSSAITIIAAAGADPTHGLPGVLQSPRNPQPAIHLGSCFGRVSSTTITAPLKALHTRDMQRLRDPVQICRVWPLRGLGKYAADLEDRIEEYSAKELSFPDDALNAFEGVLAKFEAMDPPVRSLCGLPIYDSCDDNVTTSLVIGLSWRIHIPYYTDATLRLDRRTVFPSWLWAGWGLNDPKSKYRLRYAFNDPRPGEIKPFLDKFLEDKSTLRHTMSLVNINIGMSDGTVLQWAQDSEHIMQMASWGRTLPQALHIFGFVADSRVGVPVTMEPSETNAHLLLSTERYGYDFEANHAGRQPADVPNTRHLSKQQQQEQQEFHELRQIILGFVTEGDKWDSYLSVTALVMVVHRREGSDAWERVNVTTSYWLGYYFSWYQGQLLEMHRLKDKMNKSKDSNTVVELGGWQWCETRVV